MYSSLGLGLRQDLIYDGYNYRVQNEQIFMHDTAVDWHIYDIERQNEILRDKAICAVRLFDPDYKDYLDRIHVRRIRTEAMVSPEFLVSTAMEVLYPRLARISVSEPQRSTDILVRLTDGSADPVETAYRDCRMIYSRCGSDNKSVVFQASKDDHCNVISKDRSYVLPSLIAIRITKTHLGGILQFVSENSDLDDIIKGIASQIPCGTH
jgi:hypothetical protein